MASGKRLAVGGHGGRRAVWLGTMAAVMVPGFEALAAVLSVLSRGADGGRVFRILSGKYPEYLAENAVPFRGRERYRPWQAMRGIPRGRWQGGCGPCCIPGAGCPHPASVQAACALSGRWVCAGASVTL